MKKLTEPNVHRGPVNLDVLVRKDAKVYFKELIECLNTLGI